MSQVASAYRKPHLLLEWMGLVNSNHVFIEGKLWFPFLLD